MKTAIVYAASFALCTVHGVGQKDCATYLETTVNPSSGTCAAGLVISEADQAIYCAKRMRCEVKLTAVITYDQSKLDLFVCSKEKLIS